MEKLGTWSISFPTLRLPSDEAKRWQAFLSVFKEKVKTATHYHENEVIMFLIHTGERYYVFMMCGRNTKDLSSLPFFEKKNK